MKKIAFAFVLLLSQVAFAQRSDITPKIKKLRNDTIVWRADSLLTKDDFKSKSKGAALGFTASGIFLYPSENGGALVFYVEAIFMKSKSYITKYSDYVLKHEQLHFDVCELYARKLRQKISETDFKKVRNVQQIIQNMYTRNMQEFSKEQEKYDKDTEHGLNAAKQQVWVDDIHKRLKKLDAYSNTEINTVK
jgi:hypothetical protein